MLGLEFEGKRMREEEWKSQEELPSDKSLSISLVSGPYVNVIVDAIDIEKASFHHSKKAINLEKYQISARNVCLQSELWDIMEFLAGAEVFWSEGNRTLKIDSD
ncbi:hypothetical protein CAPTEDRAFT_189078 [Capitella teleta]|uniref:Uncharacterized protein n=1 Tax=Capitella teleta TaxID=283909 RepID=R7T806_CAPTE|nr:hypothetical protein CAPTEDRAFT_189078 [Capitella teleta]|eukprot:ELT87124.1 hypothetical protein CAPTEDRAFT_189078 [Capitella teleta]